MSMVGITGVSWDQQISSWFCDSSCWYLNRYFNFNITIKGGLLMSDLKVNDLDKILKWIKEFVILNICLLLDELSKKDYELEQLRLVLK